MTEESQSQRHMRRARGSGFIVPNRHQYKQNARNVSMATTSQINADLLDQQGYQKKFPYVRSIYHQACMQPPLDNMIRRERHPWTRYEVYPYKWTAVPEESVDLRQPCYETAFSALEMKLADQGVRYKMLLDFEQYGEPLHETLQRQLMEIRYPVRAPRTSRDARDVRRQRGYVENVPIHRNINYMPEVGGDPMTYEEWLRGDNLEPLPACS